MPTTRVLFSTRMNTCHGLAGPSPALSPPGPHSSPPCPIPLIELPLHSSRCSDLQSSQLNPASRSLEFVPTVSPNLSVFFCFTRCSSALFNCKCMPKRLLLIYRRFMSVDTCSGAPARHIITKMNANCVLACRPLVHERCVDDWVAYDLLTTFQSRHFVAVPSNTSGFPSHLVSICAPCCRGVPPPAGNAAFAVSEQFSLQVQASCPSRAALLSTASAISPIESCSPALGYHQSLLSVRYCESRAQVPPFVSTRKNQSTVKHCASCG